MEWEEKTLTEKVSYIKGLADGLKLGDSAESTILKAVIDLLDDIALSVSDLEDELDVVEEQLDAVDEDLDELENFVYDELDCDCDCDCCDDDYDYDDCDCCDCCEFEIQCPECGEVFSIDEDILDEGKVNCPKCNNLLEFDFEEDEDDED